MPSDSAPVRVQGRAGLRALLSGLHKEGATCSRDPGNQFERGGWARGSKGNRLHLFGGAAEVIWTYCCPSCKAKTRVVVE